MYVLLEFWQKTIAIPIMNPLSWFMIMKSYGMQLSHTDTIIIWKSLQVHSVDISVRFE